MEFLAILIIPVVFILGLVILTISIIIVSIPMRIKNDPYGTKKLMAEIKFQYAQNDLMFLWNFSFISFLTIPATPYIAIFMLFISVAFTIGYRFSVRNYINKLDIFGREMR